LEKKEKPSEVYNDEEKTRAERQQAGTDHAAPRAKTEEEQQEQQLMEELRRKWITKVTFEGGSIPPDGFQQFLLSFQLPQRAGRYRFTAVQTYSDGKEVAWSELVEGAERPAATLAVEATPWISYGNWGVALSILALFLSAVAFRKRSSNLQKDRDQAAIGTNKNLASAGGHGLR
jgi:hypothetical protein